MNEHTERFSEEASGIFARLLDRERIADPEEAGASGMRDGLYVGDVQEEARQFWNDLDLIESFGLRFPVFRFDNDTTVPVALAPSPPFPVQNLPSLSPRARRQNPFYDELFYRFVREWQELRPAWMVDIGEAAEIFRRGAVDFLATRVASVASFFGGGAGGGSVSLVSLMLPRTWLGQARVKTVGFTVSVRSSDGLRIHVSPSFRVNWRYFGAPSSPTVSALTGGIYLFAADGGPYMGITPDTGIFDIPYQTVSPKLNL